MCGLIWWVRFYKKNKTLGYTVQEEKYIVGEADMTPVPPPDLKLRGRRLYYGLVGSESDGARHYA